MSGEGISQIVVYALVLIALCVPARALDGAGVHGPARRRAVPRLDRARLLQGRAHRPRQGAGLEELRDERARLQHPLLAAPLRDPARPGPPVPEPGPHEGRAGAPVAEHGRELHHEHELAVLRRRVHDVVPHPDGRARRPELRLCGRRDRGARRRRPRDRPSLGRDARELLGRPLPRDGLRPASARDRRHGHPDVAGRPADPQRPRDRDDAPGSAADDRPRPGRPRRSRSSSSGRTAAASTTRTPRFRSRIRPASRTSSRCSRSC